MQITFRVETGERFGENRAEIQNLFTFEKVNGELSRATRVRIMPRWLCEAIESAFQTVQQNSWLMTSIECLQENISENKEVSRGNRNSGICKDCYTEYALNRFSIITFVNNRERYFRSWYNHAQFSSRNLMGEVCLYRVSDLVHADL